jgi:Putative protein-S-isoprenylcysteine methyltransferase
MRLAVLIFWLAMWGARVYWALRWGRFARVEYQGPRWERHGSRLVALAWQLALLGYMVGFEAPRTMLPLWIVTGTLLTVAALALQWWAQLALGPNYSADVGTIEGGWEVAAGPYRWLRHPMYIASALWVLGAILFTGSLLLGVSGLVFYSWIASVRIPVEDRFRDHVRSLYVGRF